MHETDLITITEAAKRSPGRPSTNCIWRWCRKGVLSRNGQRIRLQHLRIGGKIFTRQQWLDEFGAQVAAADAEYFDAAASPAAATRAVAGPSTATNNSTLSKLKTRGARSMRPASE